ncbi:protein of unknown function [Parasporobacterium paucivorans DSM 15970]|uniref:Prolow-density lipoprotein receptor-related protein 1-like beta-propeller domain-containing protein n=2 Tax=Parasporobacterium TaxID=115543 RepID=A0A1M6L094_9FIRM|nr:protein of unknown function [Parasporobacterium paucivorans DSM 15970]
MAVVLTIALSAGCGTGGNGGSSVSGVMQSGGWVYYIQKGTLYSMKPDWTEKTKIADNFDVRVMIVQDDIIYYADNDMNVYKMMRDGTGKTNIMSGENIYGFEVSGEWLYYSVKPGIINRIKTDGTGKTKLADIDSFKGAMWVSGGSIYYIDGTSLMKMTEDGTGVVELGENLEINGFKDDWVYYSEVDQKGASLNINRMRQDGTENARLADVSFAAMDGDWLYYVKDDGWLYRSNLDGTGEEKLNNVNMWNLIGIWGEYIYYSDYEGPVYRIDLNGSNKMELK